MASRPSIILICVVSALLLIHQSSAYPTRKERSVPSDSDGGLMEKFTYSRKIEDGERKITVIYRLYKDGELEKTKRKTYPLPSEDSETIKEIVNKYKEEIQGNQPDYRDKFTYSRKTVNGERKITVIYRLYKDGEEVEKKKKMYPLEPDTRTNIKAIIKRYKETLKDKENNDNGQTYPKCLHPNSALYNDDGLLLFQGEHYYKVNNMNTEAQRGPITDLFKNLPWEPHAATAVDDKVIFFHGHERAIYQNGQLSVSHLPNDYETPIDAVASHDNTRYFISGCDFNVYEGGKLKSSVDAKDLNLPCDIDAAWSNRESGIGSMTVLKNGLYWVWGSYHSKAMGPFKGNDVIHLNALEMCLDKDDDYGDIVPQDTCDEKIDTREAPEIIEDNETINNDEDFKDTDEPTDVDSGSLHCLHPHAATHNDNGNLIFFQGHDYVMVNSMNNEEERGKISDLFNNLPWQPQASFYDHGKTIFYNGHKKATSSDGQMSVSDLPKGYHVPIDAVATHDDIKYFISGCDFITYEGDTLKSSTDAKKLNLPCDVDAAWSNRESGFGSMTVLKNDQYWVWPQYHRKAIGPFKANGVFHLNDLKICS